MDLFFLYEIGDVCERWFSWFSTKPGLSLIYFSTGELNNSSAPWSINPRCGSVSPVGRRGRVCPSCCGFYVHLPWLRFVRAGGGRSGNMEQGLGWPGHFKRSVFTAYRRSIPFRWWFIRQANMMRFWNWVQPSRFPWDMIHPLSRVLSEPNPPAVCCRANFTQLCWMTH